MPAALITTKGQITIPKKVRDSMHLQSGDRVKFVLVGEGRYEMIAVTKSVEQLKGIVKNKNKRPVSIEEMNAAISAMGR
jgi:antitoxin PrlF